MGFSREDHQLLLKKSKPTFFTMHVCSFPMIKESFQYSLLPGRSSSKGEKNNCFWLFWDRPSNHYKAYFADLKLFQYYSGWLGGLVASGWVVGWLKKLKIVQNSTSKLGKNYVDYFFITIWLYTCKISITRLQDSHLINCLLHCT